MFAFVVVVLVVFQGYAKTAGGKIYDWCEPTSIGVLFVPLTVCGHDLASAVRRACGGGTVHFSDLGFPNDTVIMTKEWNVDMNRVEDCHHPLPAGSVHPSFGNPKETRRKGQRLGSLEHWSTLQQKCLDV